MCTWMTINYINPKLSEQNKGKKHNLQYNESHLYICFVKIFELVHKEILFELHFTLFSRRVDWTVISIFTLQREYYN